MWTPAERYGGPMLAKATSFVGGSSLSPPCTLFTTWSVAVAGAVRCGSDRTPCAAAEARPTRHWTGSRSASSSARAPGLFGSPAALLDSNDSPSDRAALRSSRPPLSSALCSLLPHFPSVRFGQEDLARELGNAPLGAFGRRGRFGLTAGFFRHGPPSVGYNIY